MLSGHLSVKIKNLCEEFSLTQTINQPTHYTEHSSSILDIILTTNDNHHILSGVGDPFLTQEIRYTSIQMKCQGGVIFVHAPRLFYYPKRRIGYVRCSLTGNKNYPAITKLTNTM